jgi:predicted anti-sigma-YlaC factor YlaD
MNCGRVSNQLSAYIDRELTGAELLSIRSHLSGCDSCRAEYEALNRMKTILGRLGTPEPRPGFVAATVRRFEPAGSGSPIGTTAGWERIALPIGWVTAARSLGSLVGRLQDAGSLGEQANRSLAITVDRTPRLTFSPVAVVRRLSAGFAWPRFTLGAATGVLAAALVLTSLVWRQPRHPDALLATIPPRVVLGEDRQPQELMTAPQLDFRLMSEEGSSTYVRPHPFGGELPNSQPALPWMPVSFQGDGYRGLP